MGSGSESCRTTSWRACTGARGASRTRRSTRASGSRSWRRWPAARPSSRAPAARPRRWPAARRAAPAGARAGASRGLGGGRGADRRGVSRVLVVVDADSLGRQRTGDETYVAGLLGALPAVAEGLRVAAGTGRPELVPPGVEPLTL